MGCSLRRSCLATPYPLLDWGIGRLPVNMGSSASALFLRKNHTFRHSFKVGTNSLPRSNIKVNTTQHPCFCARALQKPCMNEVVSQIEVGPDPHVGLAQGHKGRHVQDP
jgi:hypothetical protein